jgi:hypothetical protein
MIMKKIVYSLILVLSVITGLVFANRKIKDEPAKKSTIKHPVSVPLSAVEMKSARKKWEATPNGILFKKWEASPEGKKVYASEAKIRKNISAFTNMEAIITSISLPTGSRLGFGVMAIIEGDEYILSFGLLKSNEYQQLHSLRVNDKIIIKSHSVSHAPKYSYPIISGDYIERDSKIIYKRVPSIGSC